MKKLIKWFFIIGVVVLLYRYTPEIKVNIFELAVLLLTWQVCMKQKER